MTGNLRGQDAPGATPSPPAPRALTSVLVDVAGDEVRVLAPAYKLIAGSDGVRFEPYRGGHGTPAPLTFRLAAVHQGTSSLPLQPSAKPRRRDDGLSIDHGGVEEQWLWRADVVEQRFLVQQPVGQGDLLVTVAVATDLHCVDGEVGVEFGREGGTLVRYGDVTAIDAGGRRVTTTTQWIDGSLQLTVPAAFCSQATWPLLIDPILAPVAVDTGNDDVQNPEVAYDPVRDRWLVVYERHQSASDIDIIARRYNGGVNLLDEIGVAIGSRESRNPAVASNPFSGQFCVVWDEDRFLDRIVLGRMCSASSANQGAEFLVADASGATNQNPAVGGTIANTLNDERFLVVSERGVASMDYTIVRPDTSIALASTRAQTQQRRPRINRARVSGEAWVVVSEAAGDVMVEATPTTGLGSLQQIPGAEFDRQPVVAGRDGEFVVAWIREDPVSDIGRLVGRSLTLNGNQLTQGTSTFSLRSNEPGASLSRDQSIPSLSCDGLRFTVAYRERQPSGILQPFAAVFGINPSGLGATFHDGHVPLSSVTTQHGAMAMVSRGDMGVQSVRSLVVFDRISPAGDRDVLGVVFEGSQPGEETAFQATRCGGTAAPQHTVTGSTLLGRSVNLQLTGPGLPLWVFGEPTGGLPPLPLCPGVEPGCRLGVLLPAFAVVAGGSVVLPMPTDPTVVGAQLAAQGVLLGAPGGCDAGLLGLPFTVGDTFVLTVR